MGSRPDIPAIGLAVAATLLAAGCEPSREELIVSWTFEGGRTCAQVGVASIQVQIAGEVLTPDTFLCNPSPGRVVSGADLGRFRHGTYAMTLLGLDTRGALSHQLIQSIEVHGGGDNRIALDLPAIAPPAAVTLRWTFAGGQSCAAAGNPILHVILDGMALQDAAGAIDLPCSQGGVDGVTVSPLDPGAHSFSLSGLLNGQAAYSLVDYIAIAQAGRNVSYAPDLARTAGSGATASVYWTFAGLGCLDGLVDTVRFYLDDVAAPDVACANGAVDGSAFSSVPEGWHRVRIAGFRAQPSASITVYESPSGAAEPLFSFYAGKATYVPVDAAAVLPSVGNASLVFQFPPGGPDCSAQAASSVSYTLTTPAGSPLAPQQVSCGGGQGGLVFCDSRVSGCPRGSLPGLSPGMWTISASTQSGGHIYAASASFPVANLASQAFTLQFK